MEEVMGSEGIASAVCFSLPLVFLGWARWFFGFAEYDSRRSGVGDRCKEKPVQGWRVGFFHLFLQPEVTCLRWEKSSGTPLEERVAFSRNPLDQGYLVFRKK